MYDFSLSMDQVFKRIEESMPDGVKTIGSEYLLREFLEIEDGIFNFLMKEYDVRQSEVLDEISHILVLRKDSGKYSDALVKILDIAKSVSYGKIKEEHILYGILEINDSIACKTIESLGLSPQDLMLDLKEIYDFKIKEERDLKYAVNLTKKALNKELDVVYEYDSYLKKLCVILNKKYKNNPLIVGEAGVGKTALVEGFAIYCINNNLPYEIYNLSLSQMLSNTKYRGDFEARIEEVMNYVLENKNAILFIDEIHTIIGTGSSENSLDVANIIKPYLARSDVKIIGATTLDEYLKTIHQDKALRRRFDVINIYEPSLSKTLKILKGIKPGYEKYHNLEIDDDVLSYLVLTSDKKILNKARPDKCIDILDEVMSYCKINNCKITKNIVDDIINLRIGIKKLNDNYHFKELAKLKFLSDNNLKEEKNYNYYMAINDNDEDVEYLKSDLNKMFGLTEESILELDCKMYEDYHEAQTLIGAPPGYVGYEDCGILSNQILKHPLSLIIIRNKECIASLFKQIYDNIINKGFFIDNKGNKIMTKHVIILDVIKHSKGQLGFNNEANDNSLLYDLVLKGNSNSNCLNEMYENIIRKYSLALDLKFNVSKRHVKKLNDILYNIIKSNDKTNHMLVLEDGIIKIK